MPSSRMDSSASRMAATPDLSSLPRTVSPAERITPFSRTGTIPLPGATVSIWAESKMGSPSPGREARRFQPSD